jgi:hypothetical protein
VVTASFPTEVAPDSQTAAVVLPWLVSR